MTTSSTPTPAALRFLDVEIDVAREVIWRRGEELRLRQKSFRVLLFLVENRGRVVGREELFECVWAGAAVTEDTLVQTIVEIRKALGDDPRAPRFIRTIPKRGYHFIAPPGSAEETGGHTTVTVATETTTSLEYELVEETAPQTEQRLLRAGLAGALVIAAVMAFVSFEKRRPDAIPPSPRALAAAGTTSDEARRLYEIAVDRANEFRLEEAVELLERAVALDPNFAMAHARLGYALGVRGSNAEKARPHIHRALQLQEHLTEKEKLIVEGWATILQGDYEKAIDHFRRIIERYPTDVESHVRLAQLLEGEQRIEESIEVFEQALVIDPARPEVHNGLGLYSLVGRHDDSIAARLRYVALRPNEPNAYDSLGLSYHAAGRYEEALATYARALTVAPEFVLARYHRAATHVQLGRFREAIADVEKCVVAARDDAAQARAYSTLADIYRIMGDRRLEEELATRVVNPTIWQPTVLALQRTEEETLRHSLDRNSRFNGRGTRMSSRSGFYIRAQLALKRGETEKALEDLRNAERFTPYLWHVESLQTALADTYRSLGRFEEARKEYTRVLTLTPRRAAALYGRARANEALGETAAARTDYREFLQLWKNADHDARDLLDARQRLARLQ